MNDSRDEQNQGDPLIDEIRAIRQSISAQFGHDIDKWCDDLQRREQEHPERIAQPAAAKKDIRMSDNRAG